MTDSDNPVCRTTCPYCGVGCGVVAPGRSLSAGALVAGDQDHPANYGRLCVKGASLHETTAVDGHMMYPRLHGRRVTWERALDEVAGAIRASVDAHGPESVAFYLSGQLLTEDYYVANKLAKGFIGTPHVDTNSRLCMASAVAAHKRAFGEDVVPGCYEDLELADLLVLTGSNAAWNHPVLYQRMKAAGRPGRRVVVIDPRRTATAELADLHLALRPGSDAILFNGLLVWLADTGALDQDYVRNHCRGLGEAMASARVSGFAPSKVADLCDLPEQDVVRFYRWFAENPRTVTAFSQGVNQSSTGTDKANAIINCHLATGRVGKPGASPFSLTGQPNAMGGREVGGLANTLAAHLDYDTPGGPEQVAEFWGTGQIPPGPGLKAVELFRAVSEGRIKVLWIMGTNPAVSLPDSGLVRQALKACPVVIASDCIALTDTNALADILLPAQGWGEKDGTVTNSERRISRQRRFLPAVGEARADWWMLAEVGRLLGHGDAFAWPDVASVFREHAQLSAIAGSTGRQFSLSALAGISDEGYEALEPVQWPVTTDYPHGRARLFGDGRFSTPDGKACLVPIEGRLPEAEPDLRWPMIVNTGRIRDQWHTMTRTARSSRLVQHRQEPFIDLHPEDARRYGLSPGDLARLEGPGSMGGYVGKVRSEPGQRPGEVFVPIHWNRQFTPAGLASDLIRPVTDPVSGQPESKYGVVHLTRITTLWHGRLIRPGNAPRGWQADYWCRVPQDHCDSWWVAGSGPVSWPREVARWLGGAPDLVLEDAARGTYRAARLVEGRLQGILLVEREAALLPDAGWLIGLFDGRVLSMGERRGLLSARDVEVKDVGPVVCSCFGVGERQIEAAIRSGAGDVEALGRALKCGTNCGSCVPELKALMACAIPS
ncbi:assimilatory nitrate reductase catalytic subunit [Marinobacter daqiaonensis]|uniref:Assimilatory nitrate reductase catalytic subunit n=1 Tax=Marinobacter daqiaonensis TaxID=650891 RepID=A0A1I6IJK8_9GAMM|nr:nitrate reductase [Marinobacter daqiaonensis]SFR66861.1 assimilatory nitrate reductase catalytic subunit [Marinobacter daqiaonensis]